MDMTELIGKFKDSTEMFESLGIATKVLLSFLALATLVIIFLVSERVYEHREYSARKLWVGQAQRNLNRKLPPIRLVAPRISRRDEDLQSIV